VLLVDDDADWRMLVRDALAQCDLGRNVRLEMHEVTDGEAAMQFLQQGKRAGSLLPSLIYLDCEMPRMDGLRLLELLRQDERLRHIPAVMLSGLADEAHMRRACDSGASAYIVKPVEASELTRVVTASARHWLGPNAANSARWSKSGRMDRAA